MFFIFDMQEEWIWNNSNNYIIKSDVYAKLIFRYISILSCAESKTTLIQYQEGWLLNDDDWLQRGKAEGGGQESEKKWLHNKWMLLIKLICIFST